MSELKHAILHTLLLKEGLCCLCFRDVQSEPIHIEDEAIVDDVTSQMPLSEVLSYTLGYDVVDNLAFEILCSDCVKSAIQSYVFIKRCRENNETFQQAIESLDNCLQINETAVNNTDRSCHSLFLSLDTSLSAHMYYDYKKPVTSIPAALARFKQISTDKYNGKYYIQSSPRDQPKTWIVPDFDEYDDIYDVDFGMPIIKSEKSKHKKSRKHKMEFLPDYVMFHRDSTAKNYICNGCQKTFDTVTILRMHYMRVHAPKKLQCYKCDRRFAVKKLLETHLSLSHTNAVCFECGKTFTNIASLKKHEISHKSTKYICKICHRVYKTLRTIKDHVNNGVCERGGRISRKSVNTGLLMCDLCGNHFASKSTMQSHMITKHGFGSDETVHTCKWCNKRFQAASSLRGHIVKHTGERKFQCDLCDEKFVTQPALVNHTRLHTGERPYPCDYCSESFISASRRMEHLRRKHWEPAIACRLCPAIFKTGAGRLRHERRHFNPSSKYFVPKGDRPSGMKEPKENPMQSKRIKRVVVRIG